MYEKLGGIKMFFALLTIAIATAAMFLGRATFGEWGSFSQWTLTALFAANGAITIASFFGSPKDGGRSA